MTGDSWLVTGDGFRATALQLGEPHQTPHFHAYYGDEVAVFAIEPIELLAGTLPRRQQRFIEAWAELHQEELKKDWDLLQQGRKPVPIRPLE